MKTHFKHFLKGLLRALFIGFAVGVFFRLANNEYHYAPLVLAIGAGLFYMHMRWIRKVNRSRDNIKIKTLT